MSNLETNLRSAAAENFRLYPECYPVQPVSANCDDDDLINQSIEDSEGNLFVMSDECEANLQLLADGYGREDGFWDSGMSIEETKSIVFDEFKKFIRG